MKKDFSKNIIYGLGCAYLALAPSKIISKQMESFVARINGPGKYNQQSHSHLAYITLSGRDILEIKELKSSNKFN
ncbi:MAG: hypothetical protein CME61_03300 [Halobacteriovoraceae bacterium]|nr:hypothetical protein [Halobacteriovoraceae bacterium]